MKNIHKYFFTIISVLTLSIASSQAKTETPPSTNERDLDFRIEKLEAYKEINKENFEVKSKELDLKLEQYQQEKTVLDYIALLVGGITFVGLWGFWQKVKSMAEKKIEEKFDNILNEKKQQLVTIIENHDNETTLKKEKSIYIIASTKADVKFLFEFFKRLGFKTPKLKRIDEYEAINDAEQYDVLFLFNEESNHPMDKEVSKRFIDSKRSDVIAFSFGQFINVDEVDKKTFASASNWSQLYGNLISAFKYQELID